MTLVLIPVVSEKAYGLAKTKGVYVFEVPRSSNKLQVLTAVRDQFKVNPVSVNVANIKPKAKQSIRGRGRRLNGLTAAAKRAYVTLKKGESLPVYAAIDEAEAKAQKAQAKAAKTKAGEKS